MLPKIPVQSNPSRIDFQAGGLPIQAGELPIQAGDFQSKRLEWAAPPLLTAFHVE